MTNHDPYLGNVLVSRMPPIPSPMEALRALKYDPPLPGDISSVPVHVRLHLLMGVRDLHVPSLIERRLLQTVDLMVRQGYSYRDPKSALTWSAVSGEAQRTGIRLPKAMAAAVEGISGVGKTEACLRSLASLGPQVIRHKSFPKLVGGLNQVVWLAVQVPPSGKARDLARALMEAWDTATEGHRFSSWLSKSHTPDGMKALDEWRQVAASGFLGILHLDEVQNLFHIRSLKDRRKRKDSLGHLELSVVEDQVLRWFLNLTNSGQIPVLVSGTPDGIAALSKRLSTLQRIHTAGYHRFDPFTDPKGSEFVESFLPQLGRLQYVSKPLAIDDKLATKILELTGGINRIIIALWIAAHRVAFERADDDLRLNDFSVAASTWLAPLAPAVSAVRKRDPIAMAAYEDLIQSDTSFWADFWHNVATPIKTVDSPHFPERS